MHREGHIGAALLAYAPLLMLALVVGSTDLALAGGLAAVGLAMLPDQDQRVPGIDHRGITHTVHFAAVVGGVLAVVGLVVGATRGPLAAVGWGVFGFAVGSGVIASHIAADALTPMGVEPYRDGRNYSYDVAKAANPLANYALLAVGVLSVGIAYVVGATVGAVVGL